MQIKKSKLRIIGGKFRGRKITFPLEPELRPSLDRIRETVFNWLSPYILNSNCLDLFAGSGIFGLEALSRGARFVCAVERNLLVSNSILENSRLLNIQQDQLQVISQETLGFLSQNKAQLFNIAFVDPPYKDKDLLINTLKLLAKSNVMLKNSKIYFECPKEHCILSGSNFPENLEIIKSSKTSRIEFYLLRKI